MCKQFGAIIFLGTFEISLTLCSIGGLPCVPPFEQMAERGVDCLKENNSKRLHDHSAHFIYNLFSNSH